MDDLVQDCGYSNGNMQEVLQSCTNRPLSAGALTQLGQRVVPSGNKPLSEPMLT